MIIPRIILDCIFYFIFAVDIQVDERVVYNIGTVTYELVDADFTKNFCMGKVFNFKATNKTDSEEEQNRGKQQ